MYFWKAFPVYFRLYLLLQLENELKQTQTELNKAQQMLESYKVHYSKKKQLIEAQSQEVEAHRKVSQDFRQKCDKLAIDNKVLKVGTDTSVSQGLEKEQAHEGSKSAQ
jgi:valyl-tRNA synthetase